MYHAAKNCEKSTKGKKDDDSRVPREDYFSGLTET